MPRPRPTAPSLYQLKVTLREVEPPVWRRLLLPGDATLGTLHRAIQIAMGWGTCHLHAFRTPGGEHLWSDDPELEGAEDEGRVTLREAAPAVRARLVYEYDFGDGWEHDVRVEAIESPEPSARGVVCVGGERACPPEDVGGAGGYEDFLEAIRDPENEQHADMLEWCGGAFDPEAFSVEAVNARLARLARPRARRGRRGSPGVS